MPCKTLVLGVRGRSGGRRRPRGSCVVVLHDASVAVPRVRPLSPLRQVHEGGVVGHDADGVVELAAPRPHQIRVLLWLVVHEETARPQRTSTERHLEGESGGVTRGG